MNIDTGEIKSFEDIVLETLESWIEVPDRLKAEAEGLFRSNKSVNLKGKNDLAEIAKIARQNRKKRRRRRTRKIANKSKK